MDATLDGSTTEAEARLKPPVGVKLLYGFGEFAQMGGFNTALGFVFFYYTAVLGLSGSLVGAALAISLAFDAAVDLLIGSWSDNIRSRFGRRLPPMAISAPMMFVALGLLFAPPSGLSQTGLFAWLTVTCLAVRSSISLFNVPYIALGAEMADGYAERSSVVAYRTIGGIIAGVGVTAIAYSIFFKGRGGLQNAAAYPGFGWTVALALLAAVTVCCLGVRRYAARLPQPQNQPEPVIRRLPAELGEIFRNSSFRRLFFSAIIFYAAIGLNAVLGSHSAVFVWKLKPETIQLLGYAYLFGILLGVALAPVLSRRLEKMTVVLVGLTLVIIVWSLLPSLRALGLFTRTGGAALGPLIANGILIGIGAGFCAIAYPSMMADAADEHELVFGSRREGLYFAGLGFAAKAASGLGVLIGGLALDLIRFPQALARSPGAVLPEGVLTRLILTHGPGAAIVGLIAMVVFFPDAITRARHDAISARLRAKRAMAGA